jgi:hypothetical protein
MVFLKIEDKSNQAKAMLALLKTMPFVEILDGYMPNSTTREAMSKAEEGEVEYFGRAKDLLDELKK